jgi:predicted small integral membrane protein
LWANDRGYRIDMSDTERPDRTPQPHAIWSEALWAVGLIGFVTILTLVASALGRL